MDVENRPIVHGDETNQVLLSLITLFLRKKNLTEKHQARFRPSRPREVLLLLPRT